MDVPVLTDNPLTLRFPVGSEGVTACALGEKAFLISSNPDTLQVVIIASEDIVEVIQNFEALPEKTVFTGTRNSDLYPMTDTTMAGVGYRASKILFASAENLIFILIGGCVRCFGYDAKRFNCFPAMILVDQDAIDFDICVCPQIGILVSVLFEGNLIQAWTLKGGVFLNLSNGVLPAKDYYRYTRIQFVASRVVCAYDDRPNSQSGYSIISVDTLTSIATIPMPTTPDANLMCTPIFDALERANALRTTSRFSDNSPLLDRSSTSAYSNDSGDRAASAKSVSSNLFAVLAFNAKQVLEFRLEIYRIDPAFGLQHIMMMPLVCVAHPTLLSSVGPWLVVGLPYGLEYYDWLGGDFAQSTLDSANILCSSISGRVADFERNSAAAVYHSCRNDMVFWYERNRRDRLVANLVTTLPIMDVVYRQMESGVFQGLQPTDLMQYGHDIGAEAVIGGAEFAARLAAVVSNVNSGSELKKNALFNEYGALMSKFVHLHPEAGISTCDGCKYCSICSTQFGIFKRGRRCALCNSPCCENCAPKYDLRDYGFMNIDPAAPIFPVCNDCICYADQTLYLLMASKRYLQVLEYASSFPEKTSGFDFSYLLGVTLDQCFLDERYEACAKIVLKYISATEQLQEWIARFGSVKQLHTLAKFFDPRKNDATLVTTIIMWITKSDPLKLRVLVKEWPGYCYDVGVVTVGIEQNLKKKKAESEMLQIQCETTPQSEDDRRSATGLLYLDADTINLLLALLHIYGINDDHVNVVRAYIEHYEQFHMSAEEMTTRRARANAVMVPDDNKRQPIPSFMTEESFVAAVKARNERSSSSSQPTLQLLDVCEYINEHNLFPITLAPYGHNNNFVVMNTMLRLHSDQVSNFLASIDFDTCQRLLDVVMQHLATRPKEQLCLLHALTEKDLHLTVTYHDRLADLYIDHRPSTFLWFAKQKQISNVDWRRILGRVQQKRMYAEMVYVVGRIGNDKDAIRIAIRNLKSVHFAMKYVSDGAAREDQDGLWQELMGHVIQNSTLIGDCMDHIAEYRNPAEFLSKIPTKNRVVIKDVGKRLGKICREQAIDKAIEDSSLDLFQRDNFEAFKFGMFSKKRAIRITGGAEKVGSYGCCGICSMPMAMKDIVIGACGHSFHPGCLTSRYDVSKQALPQQIKVSPTTAKPPTTRGRGHTFSPVEADHEHYEDPNERAVIRAGRLRAARRHLANYSILYEEGCRDIFKLLPLAIVINIISYVPVGGRGPMREVAGHWEATIDGAKTKLVATAMETKPTDAEDLLLHYKYIKQNKKVPAYFNTAHSTTIEFGSDLYEPNPDSNFTSAACAICESAHRHQLR